MRSSIEALMMQSPLKVRLFAGALVCLGVASLGACGAEPETEYTLALTVDRVAITSDGSDAATVRVSVLDQSGFPPPIGSTVLIQAQNGNVNATGSDTGDSLTDAAGTATFTVRCTSQAAIQVLGLYEGSTGFLLSELRCQAAPAGDWRVVVASTPRSVRPQQSVTISVDAVEGNGSPVPRGTAINLFIDDPNPGAVFRTGGATRQIQQVQDASGRITAQVIAPQTNASFTVCARFADQRLGSVQRCVTVAVSDRPLTSGCTGVFTPDSIPSDGESISTLTFSVFDEGGQPVRNAEIETEILFGSYLEFEDDPESTTQEMILITDDAGQAELQVLAPDQTGTAEATAIVRYQGDDGVVEEDCRMQALVYYPPPICEFDAVAPIRVSETGELRVCFRNPAGDNVTPNTPVQFRVVTGVGGAAVTATTAFIDPNDFPCARTGIAAGTISGSVEVEARLDFGSRDATCQSGPISIIAGPPSAQQFNVVCEPRYIGARVTQRGDVIETECPVACSAQVLDSYNNPVEGAEVYFSAEAGNIDPVGVTDAAGVARVEFRPRGLMPQDVAPLPGEPTLAGAGTTFNPRDALVTIIAHTSGQEARLDASGSGRTSPADMFIDLPEPFVDADDDNEFRPGSGTHERFIDVATPTRPYNNVWDGPNGRWDSNTAIWAPAFVVYTGNWSGDRRHFVFQPLFGAPVVAPNTISPPGVLFFDPRDDLQNGLFPQTAFEVTTSCQRLRLEGGSFPKLGGVFDVFTKLRYFAGGAEVSAESENVEYAIPFTTIVFGGDGPGAAASIDFGAVGAVENCAIRFAWDEPVDPDCESNLTIGRSVSVNVTIPARVE